MGAASSGRPCTNTMTMTIAVGAVGVAVAAAPSPAAVVAHPLPPALLRPRFGPAPSVVGCPRPAAEVRLRGALGTAGRVAGHGTYPVPALDAAAAASTSSASSDLWSPAPVCAPALDLRWRDVEAGRVGSNARRRPRPHWCRRRGSPRRRACDAATAATAATTAAAIRRPGGSGTYVHVAHRPARSRPGPHPPRGQGRDATGEGAALEVRRAPPRQRLVLIRENDVADAREERVERRAVLHQLDAARQGVGGVVGVQHCV